MNATAQADDSQPAIPEESPQADGRRYDEDGFPLPPAVTLGGILKYALPLLVIAILGAAASVYLRHSRSETTVAFFGQDYVDALQLSPTIYLEIPKDNGLTVRGEMPEDRRIELTGVPSLAHLRLALIDQRHYQWDTQTKGNVQDAGVAEPMFASLDITHPSNEIPPMVVELELSKGWVGVRGFDGRVQLRERPRNGLENFLKTVRNVRIRGEEMPPGQETPTK